ncbi:MAG: hypothetical protein Q4A82_03750 [Corynebacterium sp.]|nr:hypothetical protein [Corynebacterium sp.]
MTVGYFHIMIPTYEIGTGTNTMVNQQVIGFLIASVILTLQQEIRTRQGSGADEC